MGKGGRFWDQLESTFGKGNVTSGYRTQEEQNQLVAQGVTKATKSSHTYQDGYDLAPHVAQNPDQIRARLAAQGLSAGKIIYETGKGKNQGTGAHWHVELASGSTPNQTPNRGGGMPQNFLAGLASKLGPETASSQNVTTNADKIFSSDKAVADARSNVQANLAEQGNVLSVLNHTTQALQGVQQTAMEQQVADTSAISKEITDGIKVVEDRVKPIFAARARIADQLTKLATMNPLERGIRGIFDLNYDTKYLQQQADRLDEAAKISTGDFQVLDQMHQYALREVSRRYGLATALPELASQQAEQDFKLVGLTVAHANDALESLKGSIADQVQMIGFKKAAREDIISRTDTPTLMNAATAAQKNGGVTMLNGVEVSYHELYEATQTREQQDLNAEAYRMSIANQRQDFAEKYATNFARSLTRPQLEAAIRNGGVYNGVQIPQDVLTNLYATANKQAQDYAQQQAIAIPSSVVAQTAADITGNAVDVYNRMKSSIGLKGAEQLGPQLRTIAAVTHNIAVAVKAGTMTPEQAQIQLGELQKQSQYYDKQVDAVILDSVGGDKRAAGYVKAFMSGTPMAQGSALEGLTYFAIKGGLPDGLAASPAAKQIFQKARAAVIKAREENPKITGPQLQAVVQQQIESVAQSSIGDMRFQNAMTFLPSIAQGAGLQFGKLNQKDWQQLVTTARNDAITGTALTIPGMDPTTFAKILQKGAPLTNDEKGKADYAKVQAQIGNYNALEQRNIMESLDELPQIAAGRSNSSLYRDALKHPSLMMYGKNLERGAANQAFGDYLIGPIGSGGFESYLQDTTALADQTKDALTHDVRKAGRERALMYGKNPIMRTSVILSTIPGVGKSGAQALTPFIQSVAKAQPDVFNVNEANRGSPSEINIANNEYWVKQDNAIFAALSATKFQDPNLEAYRKTALKGWKASATQEMTFMDKFLDITREIPGKAQSAADSLMRMVAPGAAVGMQFMGTTQK